MIIEINGFYGADKHIINIDKIETVSMEREKYTEGSDKYNLIVLMTNQTLKIEFLSYKDNCETEYNKLLDAIRHREGELKFISKEN